MIDSNNINVMREKLRRVGSGGGSGVQEEIERIDNLIGSSPIPGTQRTITGSLNYLYDNIGGGINVMPLENINTNGDSGYVIDIPPEKVINAVNCDSRRNEYYMVIAPSGNGTKIVSRRVLDASVISLNFSLVKVYYTD